MFIHYPTRRGLSEHQMKELKEEIRKTEYQKTVEPYQKEIRKLKQEIERLNNKIKRIVYQCYKSDMSYEEFKQIWVNAMEKIYEPSQIDVDELEKELGVDKE